ncbi:LysR substrate-binding domain-containing protein [Arhodomonas aquaeolei]|uniref:LysR family transcriptional regulator n=1 Tax=Arhodomonas aquaeolei TaxID=2369 RepID=UPI002168E21D|nr:LysR substrate-binding domain-containing protein [Arhodomonas aquaeolei]MCS4504793.1 LysR substrate-binding domain-containing protein [Arhodomonas aquaeolei]
MDLRQLRYFVAIVESGSIKRAAMSLYVAQPSLSQHVRNLEEELGVTLLTRSARGVSPTEAGLELLGYARSILSQLEQAREALRAGSVDPHGSVRLGLPNSVSLVLGVPLVEMAHHELPNVSLRVVESMSGYILDWLRAGQLDLAMLYGVQRSPGISARQLLTEDLYLVSLPGAGRDDGTVDMQELERFELILPARPHGLRELVEKAARDNGVRLWIRTEIDALTQIKALVRRGLGQAVLSHSAVYEELSRGELVARRIVNPAIDRTVYVAEPSDRPISHAARAVAELLTHCARGLVEDGRWRGELCDTQGYAVKR